MVLVYESFTQISRDVNQKKPKSYQLTTVHTYKKNRNRQNTQWIEVPQWAKIKQNCDFREGTLFASKAKINIFLGFFFHGMALKAKQSKEIFSENVNFSL